MILMKKSRITRWFFFNVRFRGLKLVFLGRFGHFSCFRLFQAISGYLRIFQVIPRSKRVVSGIFQPFLQNHLVFIHQTRFARRQKSHNIARTYRTTGLNFQLYPRRSSFQKKWKFGTIFRKSQIFLRKRGTR